jgi:hypothetical protein
MIARRGECYASELVVPIQFYLCSWVPLQQRSQLNRLPIRSNFTHSLLERPGIFHFGNGCEEARRDSLVTFSAVFGEKESTPAKTKSHKSIKSGVPIDEERSRESSQGSELF